VDFEQFWINWPKKVAKKKAEHAWSKLTLLEKREAMEALPKHLRYWQIKQTEIDYIERETKNVVGSDDLQSNRVSFANNYLKFLN